MKEPDAATKVIISIMIDTAKTCLTKIGGNLKSQDKDAMATVIMLLGHLTKTVSELSTTLDKLAAGSQNKQNNSF